MHALKKRLTAAALHQCPSLSTTMGIPMLHRLEVGAAHRPRHTPAGFRGNETHGAFQTVLPTGCFPSGAGAPYLPGSWCSPLFAAGRSQP